MERIKTIQWRVSMLIPIFSNTDLSIFFDFPFHGTNLRFVLKISYLIVMIGMASRLQSIKMQNASNMEKKLHLKFFFPYHSNEKGLCYTFIELSLWSIVQ